VLPYHISKGLLYEYERGSLGACHSLRMKPQSRFTSHANSLNRTPGLVQRGTGLVHRVAFLVTKSAVPILVSRGIGRLEVLSARIAVTPFHPKSILIESLFYVKK
jgi:hypothetical protein